MFRICFVNVIYKCIIKKVKSSTKIYVCYTLRKSVVAGKRVSCKGKTGIYRQARCRNMVFAVTAWRIGWGATLHSKIYNNFFCGHKPVIVI